MDDESIPWALMKHLQPPGVEPAQIRSFVRGFHGVAAVRNIQLSKKPTIFDFDGYDSAVRRIQNAIQDLYFSDILILVIIDDHLQLDFLQSVYFIRISLGDLADICNSSDETIFHQALRALPDGCTQLLAAGAPISNFDRVLNAADEFEMVLSSRIVAETENVDEQQQQQQLDQGKVWQRPAKFEIDERWGERLPTDEAEDRRNIYLNEAELLAYEDMIGFLQEWHSGSIDRDRFDVLKEINGEKLHCRLQKPWEDRQKDSEMLALLALAVDSPTDDLEILKLFLTRILDTKFFGYILKVHMIRAPFDEAVWDETMIGMVHNCLRIFHVTAQISEWERPPVFIEIIRLHNSIMDGVPDRFWKKMPPKTYDLIMDMHNSINLCYSDLNIDVPIYRPAWMDCENEEPPECYRELPVVPMKNDVLTIVRPYIRRNIVEGEYDNAEHYLDVQFRLLREDLIGPLRDGLVAYKKSNGQDNLNQYDLFVINSVTLEGEQISERTGDIFRYIKLEDQSAAYSSRQLLFGQIVVLSSDRFVNELHFANIVEVPSPPTGRIGLVFENREDLALKTGRCYTLVESNSYLEAYKHVLRALQRFSKTDVPFSRYLVRLKTDVLLPKYLREEGEAEDWDDFEDDLSSCSSSSAESISDEGTLVAESTTPSVQLESGNDERTKRSDSQLSSSGNDEEIKKLLSARDEVRKKKVCEPKKSNFESLPMDNYRRPVNFVPNMMKINGQIRNVLTLEKEMQPGELGMDESQFQAFCYALYSELALIQGPPGTGKTFVGRMLVRVLLKNMDRWNPDRRHPLLIVCFTNHALDQFLEGILEDITNDEAEEKEEAKKKRVETAPVDDPYDDEIRWNLKQTRKFGHRGKKTREEEREALPHPAIIRMGTRSASEIMIKHQLKDVVKQQRGNIPNSAIAKRTAAFRLQNEIAKEIKMVTGLLRALMDNVELISWRYLQQAVEPKHRQQMLGRAEGFAMEPDEMLGDWLSNENAGRVKSPLPEVQETKKKQAKGKKGKQKKTVNLMEKLFVTSSNIDKKKNNWTDESIDKKKNDWMDECWENNSEDEEYVWDDLKIEVNSSLKDAWLKTPEHNFHVGDWDLRRSTKVTIFKTKIKEGRKVGYDDEIVRRVLDNFAEKVLKTAPLSSTEMAEIRDIFDLPLGRRWAVYQHWAAWLRNSVLQRLPKLLEQYGDVMKSVANARRECDMHVLRKAKVIGCTTTGAAKIQPQLAAIGCRIVIVEEAAEVLEAHLLASLTASCQQAILIGDHQQLRPNNAVHALAKIFKLEVSMFERLIRNNFPSRMLRVQHRMSPIISQTLMPHFYSRLTDAENVKHYPSVRGMQHNLFFVHHNEAESAQQISRSRRNDFEADFVAHLLRYVLRQGCSPKRVVVLCAYSAQMLAIAERVKSMCGEMDCPRVETIDSFQGEEAEIVIVSLTPNRVCVALSRAKHGLYVIGNIHHLADHSILWRQIRKSLVENRVINDALPIVCPVHGTEQMIYKAADFEELSPNGGCSIICSFEFRPCGHRCERVCHLDEVEHRNGCQRRCTKKCHRGHFCRLKCSKECNPCDEPIKFDLACEHKSITVPCFLALDDPFVCMEPVTMILPCGHPLQIACGLSEQGRRTAKCDKVIQVRMPASENATLAMVCHVYSTMQQVGNAWSRIDQ